MKTLLILFTILSYSVFANNDVLLKQGETVLTFKDVDGFAFKMPNDIRSGFFSKPDRVEKTLGTLLNMKHVYEYSNKHKIIDKKRLNQKVDEKVHNLFAYDDSTKDIMEKENTYKTIRHFLTLEQNYKLVQENMLNNISTDEIMEYVDEYFKLHQNEYQIPETRKIQYLSIDYNETNKKEQNKTMRELLNSIKSNKIKFSDVSEIKEYSNIKISEILKYYIYSNKQKKFSDFVFSSETNGVINGILELSNKYILVNIISISPTRLASLEEVKDELIVKFKKDKFQRDFKELLIKLTGESIEINDENMKELINRYQ